MTDYLYELAFGSTIFIWVVIALDNLFYVRAVHHSQCFVETAEY